MFVDLLVSGIGHHVGERLGGGVLHDQNRIPPRTLTVADDVDGCGAGVADGPTDSLQMWLHFPGVLPVPVFSFDFFELEQIYHHHRLTGRQVLESLEVDRAFIGISFHDRLFCCWS